jgi:hypothetical protein
VADEKDEKSDWKPDRDITRAELETIAMSHEGRPTCHLCGQTTNALDRFGLCSKTSEAHKNWRAGVRLEMKAAAR